ncbi:MAG TPA: hypothetical protein PKH14_13810 [Syntrophorhabdus sp.]|nr:hypothetical protein [Syntrophorhabdus sp.]
MKYRCSITGFAGSNQENDLEGIFMASQDSYNVTRVHKVNIAVTIAVVLLITIKTILGKGV